MRSVPGYVRTPPVEGQIQDQAKRHRKSEQDFIRDGILATQPSKRFVEITEVAEMVWSSAQRLKIP